MMPMVKLTATVLLLVCFVTRSEAFVARPSAPVATSTTSIFYQDEQADASVVDTSPLTIDDKTTLVTKIQKKPTIYPISSLDELHEFLQEDDDRLTVIKFYAPWCKSCQRLGKRYHRLATNLGDGVDRVARKKVTGRIRCAEVEYGTGTSRFIREQLQLKALPTLQLYKGTTKLFQSSGGSSIKKLEEEVQGLLAMRSRELEHHTNTFQDDGILLEAVEDSFFDNV